MAYSGVRELIIENRHNGERLALRRVKRGDEVWLELKGSLPHIGKGLLSIFTSRRMKKGSSDPARCRLCSMVADSPQARESGCRSLADRPTGGGTTGMNPWCSKATRGPQWTWTSFFDDLEVLNAGSANRPPLFYMAHLLLRHRHTQTLLIMPRPIQAVLFRVIVTVGTLLGRYRGDGWPGCPSRCVGAPFAAEELT